MSDSNSTTPPGLAGPGATPETAALQWQRTRRKRIAFLTLPLLIMATLVEYVILATGWKYQQLVCLPQGMGVTFFGIGPIGATILAVELLKLPLAIWTASRVGWQKAFMLVIGLPLICVLTFQLVKDMAVYEMGVAMTPATQLLEKAAAEEVKMAQLNNELKVIEEKRTERERKLEALAAKQSKAKAELEESLQRNDTAREDAISLTDYQKKELSEVESRQAAIIQQFNSDTEQLTKAITELRTRREAEFARAARDSVDWQKRKEAYDAAYAKWHTEDARIDNAYKTSLSEYTNKKAAYEKDLAEYNAANFLRRQLMREPVDPGVAPVREANKFPKPVELDDRPSVLIAEIDAQLKAKEAELLAVNNKRRDRIAQVDADARRLREDFDRRSTTKREETDRKREGLVAALAALAQEEKTEREAIDREFNTVLQTSDGIRAEIDASRKKAEGFYQAREDSIRQTQVHRIATTVEIVRGLLMGERPMSIKITAKERGDILTDQISMVRIWVYPVLAFIVAFLPTLMVEIGFSTVFKPEKPRPPYRLGFLGRRLHWLYKRAGRQKILRAERLAAEAHARVSERDQALAEAQAATDNALRAAQFAAGKALAEKQAELDAAQAALQDALAAHERQLNVTAQDQARLTAAFEQQLKRKDDDQAILVANHAAELQRLQETHAQQFQAKETEWVSKLAGLADSLNRTVIEKDALRDLQKSEIERQVQMRQNAWSERLTQLRQELDEQRAAAEAERTALMQEHHRKLLEVSEDCKNQVVEARRQAARAELDAVEAGARLSHELKEAVQARDAAEAQLQQQSDAFDLKLAQAREDATREMEKSLRQEKLRLERHQLEFAKTLRQREEDLEHRLKQREQELTLASEARLAEAQSRAEQAARRREAELERQFETRAHEVEARWKLEAQQREEAAEVRLKQREQQLQAQADARLGDLQAQTEQALRRRESEADHRMEVQLRETEARLNQEAQQKELAFQSKLRQREQELAIKAAARETELQNQWAAELRAREEELERQADSRLRATEDRLSQEAQQKEELLLARARQREQQWQNKMDDLRAELKAQADEQARRRDAETETRLQELESQFRQELQEKEDAALARAKQREQEVVAQMTAQAEARHLSLQAQWEAESEKKTRAATEPFKVLLARAEAERDLARDAAAEQARQVQNLEKRLAEVSSFLETWRNGKHLVAA